MYIIFHIFIKTLFICLHTDIERKLKKVRMKPAHVSLNNSVISLNVSNLYTCNIGTASSVIYEIPRVTCIQSV